MLRKAHRTVVTRVRQEDPTDGVIHPKILRSPRRIRYIPITPSNSVRSKTDLPMSEIAPRSMASSLLRDVLVSNR